MSDTEIGFTMWGCMAWLISPAILLLLQTCTKISRMGRIAYLVTAPVSIPLTVVVVIIMLAIHVINED